VYQISGNAEIFKWIEHETDSNRCHVMLDWLVEFAREPLKTAQRVPGILAPVYITIVPLPGTPAVVRFLVADQFNTLVVKKIVPLP
jgi:hypothetical protein